MDINPSLQILGWYIKGTGLGLGKNPQKSKLVHCWQCLLSGATELRPHGLRETSAMMAWHAWCVDKAPAKTYKKRNARLDAH